MNRLKLLKRLLLTEDREELRQELRFYNLERVRSYIIMILLIEFLLFIIDEYLVQPNGGQNSNDATAFLLLSLLIISVAYLLIFNYMAKRHKANQLNHSTVKGLLISYITLLVIWGAILTLRSGHAGENLAAFLVIIFFSSLLMFMDSRVLFIPYLAAIAVYGIGHQYALLPASSLVRNYINLSVFIALAWFVARTLFNAYTSEFKARDLIEIQNRLLKEANQELLQEVVARKEAQEKLELANQELVHLSLIDQLTGIPNRRNLDLFLNFEWQRGRREKSPISFIMIDIDSFKAYNDWYGHVQGDQVLAGVAKQLDASRRRSTDFVARYGGEEFLFLALNIGEAGTYTLAELLRKNIEALHMPHAASPGPPWLTVSLGTTTVIPGEADNFHEAINMADQALYEAKRAGGNQTRIYRSPQETLF